jgi:hypothetical protein
MTYQTETETLIERRAKWLARRMRISITRALLIAEIGFVVGAPR